MVKRNAEGAERSEGGGITQAGWYHFMVEEAEENDYSAKLVCNVAAGEHPEEVGRKLTHFVNFQASDPGDKQKQATITRMMFDVAEALGLEDRGILRKGYKADIAVFDPENICDEATYLDPHEYSSGIHYVIVNGILAIDKGEYTHSLGGRVLLHKSELESAGVS